MSIGDRERIKEPASKLQEISMQRVVVIQRCNSSEGGEVHGFAVCFGIESQDFDNGLERKVINRGRNKISIQSHDRRDKNTSGLFLYSKCSLLPAYLITSSFGQH